MSSQNDLPEVNLKLADIVAGSSVLPPWHDAWRRLSAESTDEESLAVYQAIRDSGYLSEEEGFYFVSRHIEAMTDLEAETKLRDLVNRMEAIEQENGLQDDEPWPEDQVPEEYEELSQKYQDAWDDIFIRKLEAFGERAIADLYRMDGDEFARRYEIGLQFFQEPVKADETVSPDELVRVASYLDLPRADLARMALAREGIPASLGNANYLYWSWDHSNAVGGVTVHVRRGDARLARKVLATARAKPSESLRPWTCPSCGQRIAGQWDACWRCGSIADGTPSDSLGEERVTRPEGNDQTGAWKNLIAFFMATAGAVLTIWLLRHRLILPVMYVFPATCIVVYLLLQFERSPGDPSQAQVTDDLSDIPDQGISRTPSAVSRAIVQRAWQAAVIALGFPPLGFYSMRLLWKLGQRDTPLSWADSLRVWTAFFLNIVTIFFCLMFARLLLFGFAGF